MVAQIGMYIVAGVIVVCKNDEQSARVGRPGNELAEQDLLESD